MLWGRSANRCALCKDELVSDPAVAVDREAVTGEEAHIVSRSASGPRGGQLAADLIDEYANLVLLCRNHHRQVDEQSAYFSIARLHCMKANHEGWVRRKLSTTWPGFHWSLSDTASVKLCLVTTGQELLRLVTDGFEFVFETVEPENEEEAAMIADVIQDLHDFSDIWQDLGAGDRVREGFRMTNQLRELRDHDLHVYAGRYVKTLHAGDERQPWPGSAIKIERTSDVVERGRAAIAAD